ncbi:MAG: hypothetical protein CL902_09000 [Dehalococcoidia bacterium]|nr:hypothetical protein [Dehalococcoidia bacterium]
MTLTTTTSEPDSSTSGSNCPHAQVGIIGAKARECLGAPEFAGEVVVATSMAAYIAVDTGDIVAVCPPSQQLHPRSLLTDLDLSNVEVGQRIWIEGKKLSFSNGSRLDLTGSRVWIREPISAANAATPQQLNARFDDLLRAAKELHQGENLGLALPFFDSEDQSSERVVMPDNASPLVSAGVQQIRELLPNCRSGNLGEVLELARELIGLGHGLTPSGDDFVGGLLFMAHHLSAVYPAQLWWSEADTSPFLSRSRAMTSQISHALMADLANGQSHESLHDLVDDLFSSGPDVDAEKHVRSVTQIGQSSGWDILTGMLAGLLPVVYKATESKS